MKLIIGNKNYSSWSLRPWLLLSAFNIPFEEERISLFSGDYKEKICNYSGAGKVPILQDAEITVWDSLAICEYISENFLQDKGWPADKSMRAEARSCCAEMHSGFSTLRNDMPMNCRALQRKVEISDDLQMDINRINTLWTGLLGKYADYGPWLFGEFSIADCMFAPVVFRFRTYGVQVSELAEKYMATVLAHPQIKLWQEMAEKEKESIAYSEVGL